MGLGILSIILRILRILLTIPRILRILSTFPKDSEDSRNYPEDSLNFTKDSVDSLNDSKDSTDSLNILRNLLAILKLDSLQGPIWVIYIWRARLQVDQLKTQVICGNWCHRARIKVLVVLDKHKCPLTEDS